MNPLHHSQFLNSRFVEMVAADFGSFQLVVPTATRSVSDSCLSMPIAFPKREYSREGWVIYLGRVLCRLFELEVGEILAEGCPFKPIKRLGPALPVAFETRSRNSLPLPVASMARFSCRFKGEATSYCSVFRKLSPMFVRIYPIQHWQRKQILKRVKQLLIEEAEFVAHHGEQLKHVPFYRDGFNLTDS